MDDLPGYDCIERNMTKEETMRFVENEYVIPLQDTNRALLPDLNVPAASPQEAAAYANAVFPPTQAGPSRAANANASYPNDFWQRVMNTLGQIQSNTQHLDTLSHIQSNTEQVVKLLTGGGHGFGPHISAVGSLKRQQAEEAEERGNEEEAEKQQKNEEGNDEELQKNEGCDNV
ncbi:unnamed protein product [Brassica rapa subsp. narinosa]